MLAPCLIVWANFLASGWFVQLAHSCYLSKSAKGVGNHLFMPFLTHWGRWPIVTFFPVTFYPKLPTVSFFLSLYSYCYPNELLPFFPVSFSPLVHCYLLSCYFFSCYFFPTWNCYFLSCYLFSCYFLSVHLNAQGHEAIHSQLCYVIMVWLSCRFNISIIWH